MDWQLASQVGGAAGIVGVLVGVCAFFQAQSAVTHERRSADASEEANSISKTARDAAHTASEAAVEANRLASNANGIAARASDEARRSADAAEASLQLQRREAEMAEDARIRANRASVTPLRWESRTGQPDGQGLIIRNYGPAIAQDIRAYVRLGDQQHWAALHELGPSETHAFTDALKDYFPVTGMGDSPTPGVGQVAARVLWKNPTRPMA